MKKLFGIFFTVLVFSSCQDEDRRDIMARPTIEKIPDSIQVLTGEFVYGTEAGVIRGEDFVYGVVVDSMAKILSDKVAPLKSDDFEMIPVTVKAKILPNFKGEGLAEIIKIQEILEVPASEKITDSIQD